MATMRRPLMTFALCELAYVVSARILIWNFSGSVFELELWWTLLRGGSAATLTWLFFQLPRAAVRTGNSIRQGCAVACGMFLAPLLVGDMGLAGAERHLIAATSLVVGYREELAYRGILQGLLTPRLGVVRSLAISTTCFLIYHWGVEPLTFHYVLQIVLCGLILGVVFHFSGSLVMVVLLHAIYDAIYAYTPFLTPRFPAYVGNVVLAISLAALLSLKLKAPSSRSA